jgi:prevent-host-death family protein
MVMSPKPSKKAAVPDQIKAGEFKAKCLELMDSVQRTGKSVVITKRGVPVAKLVPVPAPGRDIFAALKGLLVETGDIMSPIMEPMTINEDEAALINGTYERRKKR